MILLRIVFAANVLVAGWIAITSLFYPERAVRTVFENTFEYSEAIRLVGALWGAIFLLSVVGVFLPERMALVLLFQLIYKGSWLLFAAWPAYRSGGAYPQGMARFFVLWVVVLPFMIPWRTLFFGAAAGAE